MSSRRVQTWVWWLLPLLVARALLPVGFMLQAAAGKLQIGFCTAGVSQLHAGADANGGTDDQQDFSADHFTCPFAQPAAAPLLELTHSKAVAFIATTEMLPPAESPYYAAGPPRFIATRGPPPQA